MKLKIGKKLKTASLNSKVSGFKKEQCISCIKGLKKNSVRFQKILKPIVAVA